MEPYIGQIMAVGFEFAPEGWAMCNGQLLPINQHQALFSLLGTKYGGNGTTNFGLPDLRGRVLLGMGHGPGLSSYQQGQVGGTENVSLQLTQIPAHNHSVDTKGLQASISTTASGTLSAKAAFPATSAPVTGDVAIPVNTAGGFATTVKDPSLGVLGGTGTPIYSGSAPNATYSGKAVPVTNGKTTIPATDATVSGSVSVPINAAASVTGTATTGLAGQSQPHSNIQPYLSMNYIIATQGIYPPRQ